MLDRAGTSPPLWAQVMDDLRTTVLPSVAPGQAIASEAELQRRYGVSRVVVRRATEEVCRAGRLRKEQGRGTFVREPSVEDRIGPISSCTSLVMSTGHQAATTGRSGELTSTPPSLRHLFGPAVHRVVRVRRTRLFDGRPAALTEAFVPAGVVAKVAAFAANESMYEAMEASGILPARADEVTRARVATRADAQALNVASGAALIEVERSVYDPDDHPVLFDITTSVGDLVRYRVEPRRPLAEAPPS